MTRGIRLGPLPARIEVKPQDCCVGVFWKTTANLVDVRVCLIPMLPLHFWFLRRWKGDPAFSGAGTHIYQPSLAALTAAHERNRDQPFQVPEALREAERRGRRWLESKNPGEA